MKLQQEFCFKALFSLYCIAVIFLCFGKFNTSPYFPTSLFGLATDKYVHFAMFLPFPILSTYSFAQKNNFWKTLFWCTIISIAFAFCLELLQSKLTDYRVTDPWDLVANVAGIVTGSLLTVFFSGLVRK